VLRTFLLVNRSQNYFIITKILRPPQNRFAVPMYYCGKFNMLL